MSDNPLADVVAYVQVSERLSNCLVQSTHLVNAMRAAYEADESIAPELQTAVKLSGELVEALVRAHKFAEARLEVALGLDDE